MNEISTKLELPQVAAMHRSSCFVHIQGEKWLLDATRRMLALKILGAEKSRYFGNDPVLEH